MTRNELVAALNHTAACLLVAGDRYPAQTNDMRRLAVRLQIMAMDMEEPAPGDAITVPLSARN